MPTQENSALAPQEAECGIQYGGYRTTEEMAP